MKLSKKLLCVILSLLMILSATTAIAFAANEVTPVIVVGGYSSSDLFLDYGTEDEEHVWGLSMDFVTSQLKKNLASHGISLLTASANDVDLIARVLAGIVDDVAGVLACNPDGTSKFNVTAGLTDPAKSNTAALKKEYGDKATGYIQLPRINNYFCDEIGAENVFNCHVDFRMGAIKCGKALDEYVAAVKAYTGASKVSLFGLSHGGMTIGVYLNLLANHPDMVSTSIDDLDKVVMFHPALAGADFLTGFVNKDVHLDVDQIVEYAEVGALSEFEAEALTHAIKVGYLDKVINKLIDYAFDSILLYWGSVWDFVDSDIYEAKKAEYLDSSESAQLIAESDFMHYDIMPSYSKAFQTVQDAGVDINIIAGHGRTAVTGGFKNSDAILAVTSTTGAKAAPYGMRFSDGYVQSGNNCTNPEHNHVSPEMDIDASYAYLPENTFYVYRQFHGQAWFDDYTMKLCLALLFTDNIEDVYSNPDFEQFEYSRTAKDEITIDFDGSGKSGYMAQDAKGVNITNLSSKTIILTSMYCRGMNLKFNTISNLKVEPNQTVYIPFSGEIADVNVARDTLVVNYAQLNTSFVGIKEIPFTVTGGKEIDYDESEPYSSFTLSDPADNVLKGTKLGKYANIFGFRSILSSIYNTIMTYFGDLIRYIKKIAA